MSDQLVNKQTTPASLVIKDTLKYGKMVRSSFSGRLTKHHVMQMHGGVEV
jgi:hypothetical protein